MLSALRQFLEKQSITRVTALGLALLTLVATLDYITGYEYSFSVFYTAPIMLVTWRSQRLLALEFCLLSAMVWLWVDQSDGHVYSNSLIPFWNMSVRLGFFLLIAYLLGELKNRLKYEQTMARSDGLTGLLNATAFREASRQALDVAIRYDRPAALGYIDIDHFKAINDTLGHSEGDRILKSVADRLAACTRSTDIVGRIGGDEFAILLPESDGKIARRVFDGILRDLSALATSHRWPIGFSIGVAVFSTHPPQIETALRSADRLMYRVKNSEKSRVEYEEVSPAAA